MREPPADLPEAALRTALCARYGISVADLTFLPLGHDSSASVYRLLAGDGTPYFLKATRRPADESSLLVPRYLRDQGISQVIAPLPSATQALHTRVDGYTLILYPFVAGNSGVEGGMVPSQWRSFGSILHGIHGTPLPPELAQIMRRETFVPAGAGQVRDVQEYIDGQVFADPEAQALATFWRERRGQIRTLVERAEVLGRRLAEQGPELVLCHADIHTANVLISGDGQIWIVDWDETVLAPKERDLMFVAGGGISDRLVGPDDEELFFEGYGATALDPLGLAYYRYAWAVSDIGAYASQLYFRPDLGPVSRREAVEVFMGLFQPGEIVTKALASRYV